MKKTIEELGEELCNYCICSDYGEKRINTNPDNWCEGINCDSAYDDYLDSEEEH